MKTLKSFIYLVKHFGFFNAIKLYKILNGNWYLYNWWLYSKTITREPVIETKNHWDESKYIWHIPTKEDINEIIDFIKISNENT